MMHFVSQAFFFYKFNITFFEHWIFFRVNFPVSSVPVFYAIKHNDFQWFFFSFRFFLVLLLCLLMGKVCHCEWTGSLHMVHIVKIRGMFNTITITFVKKKNCRTNWNHQRWCRKKNANRTFGTFCNETRKLHHSNWINM